MVLLSHPMGNANVRAIAAALERNEMLDSFHTSIATFPGNLWDRLGGVSPLADFRRRSFATNLRQKTHQYPYRELGRMVSAKAGLASLSAGEKGPFCVDRVYHSLDRKVAAYLGSRAGQDVRMVYAYEDGALASFQAAKKRGIACIYDLPIAYWGTGHRLLEEEAERLPEWAVTLGGGISDSARKRQRKDEELALADAVVGPGSFVMDSLPAWASNKQRIVAPFGSPQVHSPAPAAAPNATTTLKNRPLRVLFAGSMGQRKGLGDLFAAVRSLPAGSIELVVLGGPQAPMSFYRQQYADFRHEGRRPHAEVLQLMASCDVFCLPSIVEGRALVMQEAMSQGLPIIITPNTGGADLVLPGETGFLVPIRSPEAIADRIAWFVDHRSEISRMGAKARQHAASYTWQAYGDTVADTLIKTSFSY